MNPDVNKKLIKNIVWIAAIAVYVWLFVSLEPWRMRAKDLTSDWGIFALLGIIVIPGLVVSCVGMILGKKAFEKAFMIFNGIYLACGVYMVYFSWTFYIFKVPTLMERLASTRFSILLGILMPLVLFYYLERTKCK